MIEYALTTFGKSLIDLTYQDISDFFLEERGESDNIEFKAFSETYGNFNTNIKGIIRAICALLNSNGGIVIWGAPLEVEIPITKEKKFQGKLAPIPEFREKDWIINKVSDSITPLPVEIKVKVLQQNPNENLYIFEVQPSPYKPHQFENIYLVRLDGQTKPAPHYFVEALFRRISYPNIEGYLKFVTAALIQNPSRYIIDLTIFLFNFSRLQNEENVIYRIVIHPGIFVSQAETQAQHTFEGKEELLHFGTPIFKNKKIILTSQELTKTNFEVKIALTIAGKKSPVKTSDYKLNLNNIDLNNPKNTVNLITSIKENQLISERQDELGTTREKALFAILGRTP